MEKSYDRGGVTQNASFGHGIDFCSVRAFTGVRFQDPIKHSGVSIRLLGRQQNFKDLAMMIFEMP